jgi:hypothetical protein
MQSCLSKLPGQKNTKKTFTVNFWSTRVDWKLLTLKYGVGFCLLSFLVSGFGWAKTARLAEPKGTNRTLWQEQFERPLSAFSDCEDEIESSSEDLVPLPTVDFQPNS